MWGGVGVRNKKMWGESVVYQYIRILFRGRRKLVIAENGKLMEVDEAARSEKVPMT